MGRLARVVLVILIVNTAASGLAMAAGRVGLTSDDGLRIVFAGFAPGASRGIYAVNPANGVITPIVVEGQPEQLACSEIDNRIVFNDYVGPDTQYIVMVNANGRNRQDIAITDAGITDFQWSPDGQQISYTAWSDGQSDIKVLGSGGAFPVATLNTAPVEASAAWSPDGRYLALDSSRDAGRYAVVLYELETNQITEIFSDAMPLHDAIWSPDQKTIAYVSYLEGVYSIHIYDVQLGTVIQSVDGALPDWSPDGSRLAFDQYPDDISTMAILDVESGDVETLGEGLAPIWSPDGEQILFYSGAITDANIAVMNADGSQRRELTSFSGTETFPCWTYLQNFPVGS